MAGDVITMELTPYKVALAANLSSQIFYALQDISRAQLSLKEAHQKAAEAEIPISFIEKIPMNHFDEEEQF